MIQFNNKNVNKIFLTKYTDSILTWQNIGNLQKKFQDLDNMHLTWDKINLGFFDTITPTIETIKVKAVLQGTQRIFPVGETTWQHVNDLNYTFQQINNLNFTWQNVDNGDLLFV